MADTQGRSALQPLEGQGPSRPEAPPGTGLSQARAPRRNRVDPWGDLHAVLERGMFTGNRGCVVDDRENVVRHHGSASWITCLTEYRGWRWPLARPRHWTPLFFLDEAVALAAGHRPCGACRRAEYRTFRDAVAAGSGISLPVLAGDLDRRLRQERHVAGRGLDRARDRRLWAALYRDLPAGAVVAVPDGGCRLLTEDHWHPFGFSGWRTPEPRPRDGTAAVLTPPSAVLALRHGYRPALHPSARSAVRARPPNASAAAPGRDGVP